MKQSIIVGASGECVITDDKGEVRSAYASSSILRELQTLRKIMAILPSVDDKRAAYLTDVATDISEKAVNELAKELNLERNALILCYLDEAGGFACGATGNAPIPLPLSHRWCHEKQLSEYQGVAGALLDNYGLDNRAAAFLKEAVDKKVDLEKLFLDPEKTAKSAGIALSEDVRRQLKFIREEQRPIKKSEREVVEFANRVIQDGRFISDWVIKPREAASKLGIKLSDDAVKVIENGVDLDMRKILGGGRAHNPEVASAVVGIIITVGIVMYSSYEMERPYVIDKSGLKKF